MRVDPDCSVTSKLPAPIQLKSSLSVAGLNGMAVLVPHAQVILVMVGVTAVAAPGGTAAALAGTTTAWAAGCRPSRRATASPAHAIGDSIGAPVPPPNSGLSASSRLRAADGI